MSLDVSDAIALARDLLETSHEFRAHDPDLAADFAGRALEICDDLGIDRTLIGYSPTDDSVLPLQDDAETTSVPATPDAFETAQDDDLDEDTRQTSEQLSALLKQQARVLKNARESETEQPKANKRSFWRFGRSGHQPLGGLQSA